MKFGPVPLEQAVEKILGHNVTGPDGRRVFRKGRVLTAEDVETLRSLGRKKVYVAELEPNDVEENRAALRVAQAVAGDELRLSGPATGRVNLMSTQLGVLRVDADRLRRLNTHLGVTLATLPAHTAVSQGKMVGTVKVIPYAVPKTAVAGVEAIAAEAGPLIQVDPLPIRRVDAIFSGSPAARDRIVNGFEPPLRQRIEGLGSRLETVSFIPLEDEEGELALADKIREQVEMGAGLIILAGETAIMDVDDIAPRAVQRAGGELTCFGAPVDPGNLLMLAYVGSVPILGAPGCVRSLKVNIVDQMLPRLLLGDRLTQADIVALGHGGLLEDVPERPYPRSKVDG